MFTTIFLAVFAFAYLNAGRYLTDKEMERDPQKPRAWLDQIVGILILPLLHFGQFSVMSLYKLTFAPSLYLRGKRRERLEAQREQEADPDFQVAQLEAEVARTDGSFKLSEVEPEPEPELELELEPESELNDTLTKPQEPSDK